MDERIQRAVAEVHRAGLEKEFVEALSEGIVVYGLWLRSNRGNIELLVECPKGQWRRVARVFVEAPGILSHIIEPLGIKESPFLCHTCLQDVHANSCEEARIVQLSDSELRWELMLTNNEISNLRLAMAEARRRNRPQFFGIA